MVQGLGTYSLQFRMNVPMYAGCKISIVLPWPDYDLSESSISGVQVFGIFGPVRSTPYQI